MVLTMVFAGAYLYAQNVRDRIHDIIAIPLHTTSVKDGQAGIIATDASYNWAKDILMFSIEVSINNMDEIINGEWIVTNGTDTIVLQSEPVETENRDLIILQGSVHRKDISEGEWTISASIVDDSHTPVSVYNTNVQEDCIPVVSFISD